MTDTLSRIYCESVDKFAECVDKIVNALSLESECFREPSYALFHDKILAALLNYPLLKIHDNKIFIRMEPKMNEELSESSE